MTRIHRSLSFVCLVSVLTLLAGAFPALALTVEEITSPRPAGWSVDLTGTIPARTLQEINRLGDQIHEAEGAELFVVVIDSTGGVPPRDFANRLFDHWRLDESAQGRSLLLFAALGDRSAEILLGRGIDTPANNQASEVIMQGEMIPHFRAGQPGSALLEGVRACSRHILAQQVEPLPGESATPLPPRSAVPGQPQPAETVQEQPASPAGSGGIFLAALASLGVTGGYFLMRTPRCGKCKVPMTLMDEQSDDAHLTATEKTEERIGSIDHKIWTCPQCGEMKKRSWSSLFSGYSRCSSCQAKAVKSTSTVLRHPTYSSSGLRRIDTSCAHCNQKGSSTQTIPRLTKSSSSSSSSRSSSSSSSSRSSGGSSSRGGSSGKL